MKIKNEFILRDVAGINLLLSVGEGEASSPRALKLNGTAAFLFSHLAEGASEETLLASLLEEYEVEEATAKKDIAEFVAFLRNMGAIEE